MTRLFGDREPTIAAAAIAFVVLNIALASTLVLAAYGFDMRLLSERGSLIERGVAPAALLRWGGLVDMLGYLAFAPVALHVHRRIGKPLLAAAGLGFALVGAAGAAALAAVGPWLLEAAARGEISVPLARAAVGTLENLVIVGLWGALGQLLLGLWLVALNWQLAGEGRRFAYLGMVAGLGALAYAIRTGVAGQPPLPLESPPDVAIMAAIGIVPVWFVGLALRLARGR